MGTPFLPNLRLQNMFPVQPMGQAGQVPFDQAPDISQVPIGEPQLPAYQPEHRAQDMMWQMIQNFPQRNNPGVLRKIAASMAGIAGGPQMADQFMHAPFYQQMQDFQPKFESLRDMANQERYSNNYLRQIADSALRDQTANRRIDIAQGELDRKTKEGQQNIAIREKSQAAREWKIRNPNHIIKTDDQGRLVGIDPQTNQSIFITGPDGQPVKSNELSAEDKANLQIEVARERGRISEGVQSRMEDKRQGNRIALLERRATLRKEAVTKDKTMSASQEAAAWKLARQQHIADNPTHSHFWDENGNPSGDAAESDDYTDAIEEIRKRFNTIKTRVTGKAPTATTATQVPNAGPPPIEQRKKGMRFKFPNGNEGEWDGTKWVPITVVKK